jgi:flagellar hook assembly protein FlgD
VENDESVMENRKWKMENYPNPFNPETTIAFYLPEECEVELGIYNLRGQLVEKLVSDAMVAGEHAVNWDGCNAGSGIYLVRLQAGGKTEMRKVVMVK